MSFSSNKAPGHDKITMSVIKFTSLHFACTYRRRELVPIVISFSIPFEHL